MDPTVFYTNPVLYIAMGSVLLMVIAWWIQTKTQDASYVDVLWALCIAGSAALSFVWFYQGVVRQWLLLALILLWSLRLAWHLWLRLRVAKEEDSRYAAMRAAMGKHAHSRFFIFFLLQAVFAVVFVLPFYIAIQHTSPGLTFFDAIGLTIFFIAWGGEAIADHQLSQFKKTHGKFTTCQVGL